MLVISGSVLMAQRDQLAFVGFSSELEEAITWEQTHYDFGKIVQNKPVVAKFTFRNTGNAPVIITEAKGSCGCTGVDYPKAAIAPGEEGLIKATFNAKKVGQFNKNVTVTANTGTKVLYIKGEVVAE